MTELDEAALKQERLDAILAEMQRKLRLRDWEIRASAVHLDDGVQGDSAGDETWMAAQLHVSNDMPESKWPHIVAHELMHVALASLDNLIRECLGQLPEATSIPLAGLIDEAQESLCNRVAFALAPNGDPFSCFTPRDGVNYKVWTDFRLKEDTKSA